MRKIIGLIAFLAIIYLLLLAADPGARLAANHFNLGRRIGLYGIISLGAGMLIITGGIDLSIGSVVGLSATLLAMLLRGDRFPRFPFKGWLFDHLNAGLDWLGGLVNFPDYPWLAILVVLLVGLGIGLVNGLLVTKVKVQAFVVTLCGLFIYRGLSRFIAEDQVKGLGNQFGDLKRILYSSEAVFGLPLSLVYFLGLLTLATVFLHLSVHGRYFFAIGGERESGALLGCPDGPVQDSGLCPVFDVCGVLWGALSDARELRPAIEHWQLPRTVRDRRGRSWRMQPARWRGERLRFGNRHEYSGLIAQPVADVGNPLGPGIHGDRRSLAVGRDPRRVFASRRSEGRLTANTRTGQRPP